MVVVVVVVVVAAAAAAAAILSSKLSKRLGIDDIVTVIQRHCFLRKDENDWVKKCIDFEVVVVRLRGRPKKT